MNLYVAVADLGDGPGGPGPPFFLDQTEPQRPKSVFGRPPPPPYLKVWIGYYTVARRYEFYVRVARTISHE